LFKVLLVDDEPWALKSIENGLNWREFGFEITGRYQSIDMALEHMVSEIPHVVVTDIRIAGNNGLDLIKWIRERGLDIEVVVVTGYSDFHVAQAAIKLGVFDFLLKPINLDEGDAFLKKLSSHLRQKTAEQRSRIKKAFENVSVADFIASLSNSNLENSMKKKAKYGAKGAQMTSKTLKLLKRAQEKKPTDGRFFRKYISL